MNRDLLGISLGDLEIKKIKDYQLGKDRNKSSDVDGNIIQSTDIFNLM